MATPPRGSPAPNQPPHIAASNPNSVQGSPQNLTAGLAAQDQSTLRNHPIAPGPQSYSPKPPPHDDLRRESAAISARSQAAGSGAGVVRDGVGDVAHSVEMAGLTSTKPPEAFGENEKAGVGGTTPGWKRISGNAFFFATFIMSFLAWLLALISQSLSNHKYGIRLIGTLWPALILQLVISVLLVHSLHSGTLSARLPAISNFTAILIVLGSLGIDRNIYSHLREEQAVAAAWVILVIIDTLWLIVSTAPPGGHVWAVVEGTGNIPLGRAPKGRPVSVGVPGSIAPPIVIDAASAHGSRNGAATPYDANAVRSIPSESDRKSYPPSGWWGGNKPRSSAAQTARSASPTPTHTNTNTNTQTQSMVLPGGTAILEGGRASTAITADMESTTTTTNRPTGLKAVALFSYSANPSDPNEMSFQKDEVMDIIDKEGKWWEARKEDGTIGIAPSNYLRIL